MPARVRQFLERRQLLELEPGPLLLPAREQGLDLEISGIGAASPALPPGTKAPCWPGFSNPTGTFFLAMLHSLYVLFAYMRGDTISNLSGQDLSQTNLSGASIRNANVSGCLFPKDLPAEEICMSLQYGTRIRHR